MCTRQEVLNFVNFIPKSDDLTVGKMSKWGVEARHIVQHLLLKHRTEGSLNR